MKRFIVGAMAFGLLGFVGNAEAQPRSVDATQALIQEAWSRVESYTASVEVFMQVPMGTLQLPYSGSGQLAFRKDGSFGSFRLDSQGELALPGRDRSATVPQDLRLNFHGDLFHLATRFLWQPLVLQYNAAEDKAEAGSLYDLLFQSMGAEATLQVHPDVTVHETLAFLIEARAVEDPGDEGTPTRGMFYFAQDTGILLRLDAYNARGSSLLALTCRDIRLNAPIDGDHFAFTPPDGYPVIDLNRDESIEIDLPPLLR